jgi:hypothetical protein
MESDFERVHQSEVIGSLTTVDRLIIRGHLQAFWRRAGMAVFLDRQGVRIVKDFGRYVHAASEKLRVHASEIARKAGRPFIYQDRVVRGKDELARKIAEKDGISQGLICVFSTLELATCFALVGGQIAPRLRKCLHFYFYLIDREFGLMHVRLQSWFPFQIQIYINGREWLGRQLDRRGIEHVRYENTFLRIEDLKLARKLCEGFGQRRWVRVFDVFAGWVNPLLPLIRKADFGSYYWVIDACEVATDVMWKSRKGLLGVFDDLFDHALRHFSARDVVRFLGRKFLPGKAELDSTHRCDLEPGEIAAAHRCRPEARRIKHRIRRNWIKMYDKWSVLRVETVINNPSDFRVLRFEKDEKGRPRGRWVPMGKGIQNLWRYLEVGEAANGRYLDALAEVKPSGRAIAELDSLCCGRVVDGKRHPRFNPVADADCRIFEAVLAGEHMIAGFRSRDLQARLYAGPVHSPGDARRRTQRVCRLIAKLRGHGLAAKVPGSRLYRVTLKGHRVMAAALRFRHLEFPNAAAA